jgi:O-antigen ligase
VFGWLLGLAVLVEGVSALISEAPVHSFSHYVFPHLALWLLFAALVSTPSEQVMRWLVFGLILVAVGQSIASIYQGLRVTLPALFGESLSTRWYVETDDPTWNRIPRVPGLTAWPTILAALLVTTAPLGYTLKERSWRVAVGVVSGVALLLSFGRAGWIGLAAGCLVGGIVLLDRTRTRRYVSIAALLLFAIGAFGGIQPRVVARLSDVLPVAPAQANQGERELAQDVALDLWKSDPLFGVGSGNSAISARKLPEYALVEQRIVPAHNWLLLGLAERGVLGAMAMVLLWTGPVVWLLLHGTGRVDAALATCFTALAVSQWFDYEMIYWIGGSLVQTILLALWVRSTTLES